MTGTEQETFNINIRDVPKELYFSTQKLKARFECSSWLDFLRKVNDLLKEVPENG